MTTVLGTLFEHNLWANRRMLDYCSKLSDEQLDATEPGVYGSIRDTLLHIFGAEERYVTQLTGQPPTPTLREREPFPDLDELRRVCEESGRQLIEIADQAKPGEICRGVRRNGAKFEISAAILLTQAINHATEHRSQINTVLTHLGLEPLELDGWAYGHERGQVWIGPAPSANAS